MAGPCGRRRARLNERAQEDVDVELHLVRDLFAVCREAGGDLACGQESRGGGRGADLLADRREVISPAGVTVGGTGVAGWKKYCSVLVQTL